MHTPVLPTPIKTEHFCPPEIFFLSFPSQSIPQRKLLSDSYHDEFVFSVLEIYTSGIFLGIIKVLTCISISFLLLLILHCMNTQPFVYPFYHWAIPVLFQHWAIMYKSSKSILLETFGWHIFSFIWVNTKEQNC